MFVELEAAVRTAAGEEIGGRGYMLTRLMETDSVRPAIALHAAWNAIIQAAFDPASTGAGAELWIGESGIFIALTMIVAVVIFSRGRWTMRRVPEVREQTGAARPAPQSS
jgi:hypothetical protein